MLTGPGYHMGDRDRVLLRRQCRSLPRRTLRPPGRQGSPRSTSSSNSSAPPERAPHEQPVQRGYDFAIAAFTRLLQARGLPVGDVAALAAIALGSVVHLRKDEALYGKTPAGATEEQFVATWVDTWHRVLESRTAEAKRHNS